MAGTGRKVWAADEILAAADLQSYIQDQVVFVFNDAAARTSGILAPTEGMVSYLKDTNLLYAFDGSSWVEIAPNVGTPGTYTKVTTDAKGRVSSGTTLAESDIPTLSISKTSGLQSALDGKAATVHTHTVAQVNGGSWTGDVNTSSTITSGAITANGIINANAGIAASTSGLSSQGNIVGVGTYNQTNSGRAMYVASNGLYGVGGSSARFKKNIVMADIDIDAVRKVLVKEFDFKPEFGGGHQVGVIAEELAALGLEQFVYFDDEGNAEGVAYDRLALLALSLAQVSADRLDLLEARISKLEM